MFQVDAISARASAIKRHNLAFMGDSGRPMLFCHGFGMDQSLWRNLAPGFAGDHHVILMDHVGSGGSDLDAYRIAKYRSIQGYVSDILDLCRALDLRHLVFVGHSVSAMLGLEAALALPERFDALVMLGASPRYVDDGPYRGGFTQRDVEELLEGIDNNREAWMEQMARTAACNPDRPELAREVEARFRSVQPAILRQFAQATFSVDFRSRLGACRTPVLLLQSREDPIVPVCVSEYLQSAIPGSTLKYLDTSGHFPQISAPGEVAGAMAAFLSSLPKPPPPGSEA